MIQNHQLAQLNSELRALREEVAGLKSDAFRYRWLRDHSAGQWEHPICVEQHKSDWGMRYVGPLTGKTLDNKIDEAWREST